jgi:hypothetical protein
MSTNRKTLSISHTSGARHRLPNSSSWSVTLRLLADLGRTGGVCSQHSRCTGAALQLPQWGSTPPASAARLCQQAHGRRLAGTGLLQCAVSDTYQDEGPGHQSVQQHGGNALESWAWQAVAIFDNCRPRQILVGGGHCLFGLSPDDEVHG